MIVQRRVYRMPRAGSINDLQLHSESIRLAGAGEVTVAVKAIGLNFADIFAMHGLYRATPPGSFIPGLEFSGEVIAAGENSQFKAGDRVMGATRFGGYASHITIDERYVIPVPREWSFDEGASFIVQGVTAYYALRHLGDLREGMTVLIHSAAGGVGIMANRICKHFGAYTIGTVGSGKKRNFLNESENYDKVITRSRSFSYDLKVALDDRKLNLVMECIGGRIFKESWEAMAPMGRLITYGSASFTSHGSKVNYPNLILKYLKRPKIDPLRLPSENKSLMGFNLIFLYDQVELMHQMLNELLSLNLRPQHVGHVFAFHQMHEAIRVFQSGRTVGKVVVRV